MVGTSNQSVPATSTIPSKPWDCSTDWIMRFPSKHGLGIMLYIDVCNYVDIYIYIISLCVYVYMDLDSIPVLLHI